MQKVQITLEDLVYDFYKKIGEAAGGRCPEQVMADALFRFAGALAEDMLPRENQPECPLRGQQN